jgi:tetratricopeptide (TPR) repeat protein
MTALIGLALAHRALGDPKIALVCLGNALQIAHAYGYRRTEAHIWGNLGFLYQEQGALDEARTCHERSLSIKQQVGDRLGEAASLGNLGIIARLRGRFEQAIAYHRQAVDIARSIGHTEGEAQDLANLALVYRDSGDPVAALAHQNDALALAEALDQPELLWRVRVGRAETYRRLGDAQVAVADLKTAVKGIEHVRGWLSRDEEKLTFFGEDKGTIYARLVRLLHADLKQDAEALAYVERARSRLFLEQLALLAAEMDRVKPLSYEQICHYLKESQRD